MSGNTVVFDTRGTASFTGSNYASAYERVVTFFDGLIRKYHKNTLFIFLEEPDYPGFSRSLLSAVQEYIELVEIKEGHGNMKKAREYLDYLVTEGGQGDYLEEARRQIVLVDKNYPASELHKMYARWSGGCLRQAVYTAYADYRAAPVLAKGCKTQRSFRILWG